MLLHPCRSTVQPSIHNVLEGNQGRLLGITRWCAGGVVAVQGEVLRIRRPHDYNPAHAKQLGPAEPSSYINLALLSVVGGLVDEATAPRISVAGLPKHLEDDQVSCDTLSPTHGLQAQRGRLSGM